MDVFWDTIRVNLHLKNKENSSVFLNKKLQEKADSTIINKAWNIFNNDSFWLVAPHKLFENGVLRSIQKVDGKDALLVKYTTGGSTPGDSYLWTLDSNYIPKSYNLIWPYTDASIDQNHHLKVVIIWRLHRCNDIPLLLSNCCLNRTAMKMSILYAIPYTLH